MKRLPATLLAAVFMLSIFPALPSFAGGGGRGAARGGPPTLGLENGTLDFDTPEFTLKLVKDSQTIAAMEPKGAQGFAPPAAGAGRGGGRGGAAAAGPAPFDFTPAYILSQRATDGYNHLGDITFRVRSGEGQWTAYTTAAGRKPVAQVKAEATAGMKVLAASDLSATLPANCPLQIIRLWETDAGGHLVLHFDIKNKSSAPVEIGALGIPVIFNNIIPGNNRAQANALCSFFDPYMGQDAGYLQVTRQTGGGPALLVTAEPGTRTGFEAYRKLQDNTPTSQTSEGEFEWMVHSKAYAENEWRNAKQWNPATSVTLAPGETVSHGLRFLVAPSIREMDKTLEANKVPVVMGVPGYILPMDLEGKLFINTGGRKVTGIETDPPNAIAATAGENTPGGWLNYTVKGSTWGRVRMTVSYDDGSKQAVHYYVTKPAATAVGDLGNFLFTKMWFDVPNDPFHRSPSIMTYDRSKNQIVTQDTRAWIAGLGDEGGSSWLTGAMKELGQPKKAEVDKYAQFIDKTLWGQLQISDGPQMYGVKKSLFYYDPARLPDFEYMQANWGSWTSWNYQQGPGSINRAYDYPHVVAAYWAMYRLARNNPGLVTAQKWEWYLDKAYQTTHFLVPGPTAGGRGRGGGAVGYINTGLMEGDIFVMLLQDLKREGWDEQAKAIETAMKDRADRNWLNDPLPFGSEMAWDSTGQEEVYAWMTYFANQDAGPNYRSKAEVALNSILGYMPTLPHWGYNGNARRYWDFQYGGAPGGGIERQLHHYGSGINSIPVLAEFRQHPDDLYLLRVGYGGSSGALSNIDQEGFASAAFHSYPQNLRWDAYTGDYAQNFFGHELTAGTYIVNSPELGWLAFGGNLKANGDDVTVETLDSFRQRIYLAPFGLYLTLDAGEFQSVRFNAKTHTLAVTFAPKGEFTPEARLRIEQPAKVAGVGSFVPQVPLKSERDAFVVPLGAGATTVQLQMK